MNGAILGSAETLAEDAERRAGESLDTPGPLVFTSAVQGATVKECCAASWTAVDANRDQLALRRSIST